MAGSDAIAKPTRVFVSYSHDSPDHMKRVLGFCDKLRHHGVETVVDRYFEDTLDMRWNRLDESAD